MLIAPGLAAADAAHAETYIEATAVGLPLYLRCGWEPVGELRIDLRQFGYGAVGDQGGEGEVGGQGEEGEVEGQGEETEVRVQKLLIRKPRGWRREEKEEGQGEGEVEGEVSDRRWTEGEGEEQKGHRWEESRGG